MTFSRSAALLLVAALVAACSGGAADRGARSSPTAATRMEVALTDALTIEPATIAVPAGQPVTFVVTNTGAGDHEFFLGDEGAQAMHEQEMQEMGGMAHDEEMGVAVEPGQTKELTITFPEAGSILAGCHVAGHYAAGMKASVEIGS